MNSPPVLFALDALTGALFLLTALGVVATRQVLASLQLFILQSLLLTVSAVLLGIALGSIHLFAVAAITIATKTLLIPWLLRHTVSAEVYRTREIERVLNIPSSLLIAAVLIVLAYVVANPLLSAVERAVCADQSAARHRGNVSWHLHHCGQARSGAAAARTCWRSRTACSLPAWRSFRTCRSSPSLRPLSTCRSSRSSSAC